MSDRQLREEEQVEEDVGRTEGSERFGAPFSGFRAILSQGACVRLGTAADWAAGRAPVWVVDLRGLAS